MAQYNWARSDEAEAGCKTGSTPMKPVELLLFSIAMLCAGSRAADAADPRYPNWPCVQAKVPDISIAAVWDGPSIEQAQNGWQNDQAIKSLVARLAARRIPIEEAQKNITEFLAGAGTAKADKGVLLFAGLFETLNRQRTDVMNGLERLQRSQRELADRIKSDVSALHELQDKSEPDQAKLDELGNRIEWSTRIFEDRRKSVRYACEVPVIIERRLFALGRTIRQEAE
jgi:hypothetical protein